MICVFVEKSVYDLYKSYYRSLNNEYKTTVFSISDLPRLSVSSGAKACFIITRKKVYYIDNDNVTLKARDYTLPIDNWKRKHVRFAEKLNHVRYIESRSIE